MRAKKITFNSYIKNLHKYKIEIRLFAGVSFPILFKVSSQCCDGKKKKSYT